MEEAAFRGERKGEREGSLYFSYVVVYPLGALVVHQNGMKTLASF